MEKLDKNWNLIYRPAISIQMYPRKHSLRQKCPNTEFFSDPYLGTFYGDNYCFCLKNDFLRKKILNQGLFYAAWWIWIHYDTFWHILDKILRDIRSKKKGYITSIATIFSLFWKQCNKQHITFVSFQLDKQDNFERVRISKWCTVDPSLQPTFN